MDRETELALLYDIASITKRQRNRTDVYNVVLDKATLLLRADVAAVYLWEAATNSLICEATQGARKAYAQSPLVVQDPEQLLFHMINWQSLESPSFPPLPFGKRYTFQAAIGVPLRSGTDVRGWLYAARLQENPFTAAEERLFNVLSEQTVIALGMTLAWEKIQQQQKELQQTNAQLAQSLAEMQQQIEQNNVLLQTIRDRAVPVLSIAPGVLLVPLIGVIDSDSAQSLNNHLLQAISERRTQRVILDVTGMAVVDSYVAGVLIETQQAAKLLGAEVILCGITPQVAQVLVHLPLDLSIPTTSDLQTALSIILKQR